MEGRGKQAKEEMNIGRGEKAESMKEGRALRKRRVRWRYRCKVGRSVTKTGGMERQRYVSV